MRSIRLIAIAEVVLILPSALFLGALAARHFEAPHTEIAKWAERVIEWYADRLWTLWLWLFTLPFAALVAGGSALLQFWDHGHRTSPGARPIQRIAEDPAALTIMGVSMLAAATLAIVTMHALMN
jgi:hypothetical protein